MINKVRYHHLSEGRKYNCFSKDESGRSETEFSSGASIMNGLINQKEKSYPNPTMQRTGRDKFPLLAIDGGGTKTIAVITDSRGKVLSSGTSGSSNYQVSGKTETIKALKHVIKKAINLLNGTAFPHDTEITFNVGVFALAGIDTRKDEVNVQEIVKQVIGEIGIHIDRVIVENDALSVLLGKTNRTPGAILISGTGSIAFAHDGKGHYVRSGGWGIGLAMKVEDTGLEKRL
ncbi:hypothetical protein KFZ56_07185 [Virgibacillus sp. NKC19-3]|nr:hypothetical protein [Virgibacillus sp. NKC19-3]